MAVGASAVLLFIQLLIADVIGLKSKHLPGAEIPTDHGNPLFRASRTVANTNESIAIFILSIAFCILSGASAQMTGYCAWAFVAARSAYAICYYANIQLFRSIFFGLSLLSLAGLLFIGFCEWF